MTKLTLPQANAIVDRISTLLLNGRNLQPVALSEVGASSTLEALNALYLVTAETFQQASLNPSHKNQELLQRFVQSADSTGMWIAMFFRDKVHPEQAPAMDESLRDTETVGSFVEYLHSLNPASNDYWAHVHARIGGQQLGQPPVISSVRFRGNDKGRPMEGTPSTTQEVNQHVLRDAIGTVLGLLVYVGLVMLLYPHLHGVAVVIFWLGAVVTGLRALQVFAILVTGAILFFARMGGWAPDGADPGTSMASLIRVVEFAVVLLATYYLYVHLYPHSHLFGLT